MSTYEENTIVPKRTFQQLAEEVVRSSTNGNADVLMQCAVELEEIDTGESRALAARSRGTIHLMKSETQHAIECFKTALAWYKENAIPEAIAAMLDYLGRAYSDLGDFATGLSYFEEALSIAKDLNPRSHAATLTGNIGSILFNQTRYAEALEYLNRAIAYHEELGEKIGVAAATTNIGAVYGEMGKFPEALHNFHRALAVYEESGNKQMVAALVMNVGLVHGSTGDEDEALKCFARCLPICEEIGDRRGVAQCLNKMGTSYRAMGDRDQAFICYQRSLSIYTEIGNSKGIAHVTGDIIASYIESGQDEKAIPLLEQMQSMSDLNAITSLRLKTNLATIQMNRNELDEARVTLESALELAHELDIAPVEADIHLRLRDLYQKSNDFAGFLKHNSEYTRISEEINGKDTAVKLAVQEAERRMAMERVEHEKYLAILHSALPKHVADRVARGEVVNDHFDNASVIFLDIVGFTTISDQLSSSEVVRLLESVFSALDAVTKKHDVVKIKTIGDSYMAVAFSQQLDDRSGENPMASCEHRAASAALEMLGAVSHIVSPSGSPIQVRLGVHCGAVTAGVIGTERMQYDVWGDTVNVASRLESTGEPGKVQVSEQFADSLALGTWNLALRGETEVKGKGTMKTYWLEGA